MTQQEKELKEAKRAVNLALVEKYLITAAKVVVIMIPAFVVGVFVGKKGRNRE